eukprot:TRINITY_DN10569_c0_g1_i1.p1 TRINITY_DN10569_c0_g1~~TRINITY_DN10569_c0_g1_i1.p1  ORF type:complete len:429 (-),score=164.07 TRINITY_DN10569_c0_g1_i1:34-1263(-)
MCIRDRYMGISKTVKMEKRMTNVTDKEKITELMSKIRDLESLVSQKEAELSQYKVIESKADEKIKAANTIHEKSIRNLMTSINLLKKENAQLKKMSQEHKRSDLIKKLNDDIRDQEVIIDAIRELVGDEEKVNKKIVEAMSKGPPRMRVLSREELRIEINRLKGLKDKGNNEQSKVSQGSFYEKKPQSLISEELSTTRDEEARDELIQKNNALMNEIEDMHLTMKVGEQKITALEELLRKKNDELMAFNNAKSEILFLKKKYDAKQSELEAVEIQLKEMKLKESDAILRVKNLENQLDMKFDNVDVVKKRAVERFEIYNRQLKELDQTLRDVLNQRQQIADRLYAVSRENENLRTELDKALGDVKRANDEKETVLNKKEEELRRLEEEKGMNLTPVSYTHLTLPTIYSV